MPPHLADPDDRELDDAPEDALGAFEKRCADMAPDFQEAQVPKKGLEARRVVLDYAGPLLALLGDPEAEDSLVAVLGEVYGELDELKSRVGALALAGNQGFLAAQATANADQLAAAVLAGADPEVLRALATAHQQQAAGARAVLGALAQSLAEAAGGEASEDDEDLDPGESTDPPQVPLPNTPALTAQGAATPTDPPSGSGTADPDPSSVAAPQRPAAKVFDLTPKTPPPG